MIKIDFTYTVWKAMTDEEQQTICKVIGTTFDNAWRPLHNLFYQHKHIDSALVGLHIFHDWLRIRTNLAVYAQPNILGEDKTHVRWQTAEMLYTIIGFLEFVTLSFSIPNP